jgi:hypothetical protein
MSASNGILGSLGLLVKLSANRSVSGQLAALLLTVSGCITSPTGAYLNAEEAKTVQYQPCPNGMIEDLEDGNVQIKKLEGRGDYWFTSVDAEGTAINAKDEIPEAGGPQASKFAAHMRGKLASSGPSVYAVMGFNITESRRPYDASKAEAIRFWGKGPGVVRFKTPDINTAPAGDRCKDCYNDFGVDIYLSETWTRYTVPFAKLKQQPGWGDRAPSVAKDALFAIQWQVSKKGAPFDLWIDDVEFVGCK